MKIGDRVYYAKYDAIGVIEQEFDQAHVYVRWIIGIKYDKLIITAEAIQKSKLELLTKSFIANPEWEELWEKTTT